MAALVKKMKGLSIGELTSLAPTLMKNVTTDMNVKTILTFAEKAMKLDMDNMKFHHAKAIKELLDKSIVHYLYLPQYSPDLNPIEKLWSKIKAILRKL